MAAYIEGLAEYDAKKNLPQRFSNKIYIEKYKEITVDNCYNLGLQLKELTLTDSEYIEAYNKGKNEKLKELGEEDGKNFIDKAYTDEIYIEAYNKSRNEKLKELGEEDGKNLKPKVYAEQVYIEAYNKSRAEKQKELGFKDGYYLANINLDNIADAYLEGYNDGKRKLGFEDGKELKEKQCEDEIYLEGYNNGRNEKLRKLGGEDGKNLNAKAYTDQAYLDAYNICRNEKLKELGFEDGYFCRKPQFSDKSYMNEFKLGFKDYLNKYKNDNIIDDEDIQMIFHNFDKIDWINKNSIFAILLNINDEEKVDSIIKSALNFNVNVKEIVKDEKSANNGCLIFLIIVVGFLIIGNITEIEAFFYCGSASLVIGLIYFISKM